MNEPAHPLRVAIVGCGAIAVWHRTAISNLGGSAKIVAAVDTDTDRAASFGAECGATPFRSLEEAMAQVEIDAVVLLVPHHLHEQLAIAALQSGVHVMLEKPLAPTVDAAQRILDAAAKTSSVFMVAENAQYWPEVGFLDEMVASGALGEVVTARACAFVPAMDDFFGGENPWRFSRAAAGGGVAIDTGSHWIRPLHRWFGPMQEVMAVTGNPQGWGDIETLCRAMCRFKSGLVATFDGFISRGGLSPSPLLSITGTAAEVTVDGLGRVRLYEASDPKGEQVFAGGYWLSYDGEWADFVPACRTGSPLAAPAEAAMGELRAALAMYRSAETKRWEPVWG